MEDDDDDAADDDGYGDDDDDDNSGNNFGLPISRQLLFFPIAFCYKHTKKIFSLFSRLSNGKRWRRKKASELI